MGLVVDLNCDMGESFGRYNLGLDEELMNFITSANIACGFHAGDPLVIEKTVRRAGLKGVSIGAHPSFPDLQGFGRRPMEMAPAELRSSILYQVGAVKAFTDAFGYPLQHVKLHGALNNMAAVDIKLALIAVESAALVDRNLIFVAPAGSAMEEAAAAAGLKVAREFFADRNYDASGKLLPRSHPAALIHDAGEALERTVRVLREGSLKAACGTDIKIQAETICLHGDSPLALQFAQALRQGLQQAGITLQPMHRFIC